MTLLSDEEILRRLRVIRHSPWNLRIGPGRKNPATIAGLARQANLNREYLHRVISGEQNLGPLSRRRLSRAFKCAEELTVRLSVSSSPAVSVRFEADLPGFGSARRH